MAPVVKLFDSQSFNVYKEPNLRYQSYLHKEKSIYVQPFELYISSLSSSPYPVSQSWINMERRVTCACRYEFKNLEELRVLCVYRTYQQL